MRVTFATSMTCQSCLSRLAPLLDGEPRVVSWQADLDDPRKLVRCDLAPGTPPDAIVGLIRRAGFSADIADPTRLADPTRVDPSGAKAPRGDASSGPLRLHAITPTGAVDPPTHDPGPKDPGAKDVFRLGQYKPLLLVVAYVVGAATLLEIGQTSWSWMRWMNYFMGCFFLGFAFFKFLDVAKFADAFAGYDIVARRWRGYALAYPAIEWTLGLLFVTQTLPLLTNAVTACIMSIGLIGVVSAVRKRQTIRCACLGTVFNLPMSVVTIIENGVMIVMSVGMLISLTQR